MKLIKPCIQFLWMTPQPLLTIEQAGRTCYKSEKGITNDSAKIFVKTLLDKGHKAMIEHASASYRVVCDRGVTHEIVRHRLYSYAQESTRYCNYKGGVTFIIPMWFYKEIDEGMMEQNHYMALEKGSSVRTWIRSMFKAEESYMNLLQYKQTPQQARSVLPNSLKTEIVITGNLREWRHFFKLRTAKDAHPQMQEIANMLLADIRKRVTVIFEGINDEQ